MADAIGLAALAGSVALYAFFPLPAKACATGDGVFFALCMSLGIYLVGAAYYALVQCRAGPACPAFEPVASIGGAVWAASNLLLIPICNALGVGPAMLVWGLFECLTGWATGRFGLFGLLREPVRSEVMNDLGVALVLASLTILAFVQPASSEEAAAAAAPALGGDADASEEAGAALLLEEGGGKPAAVGINAAAGPAAGNGADDAHFALHGHDFTASLSPPQKRAFGFAAALVAGVMSGSTFTPAQYVIDHRADFPGASSNMTDLVFSHFTGVAASSVLYFIVYCAATRNRPWVSAALCLPGLASGVSWGLAFLLWALANQRLSIVVAFPVVTIGPGVLTSVMAIYLFGEIKGSRNLGLVAAAVAVYSAGAVLIALSNA